MAALFMKMHLESSSVYFAKMAPCLLALVRSKGWFISQGKLPAATQSNLW